MIERQTIDVGDTASLEKKVSEADIVEFAEITGDKNPVHLDEDYARQTVFGTRIAHGMLSAGYISAVLGMKLPGPGAVYMKQTLTFLAPVKIGDVITTTVEVIEIGPKRKTAKLKTHCTNQDGVVVLEGEATISLPRHLR